MPKPLCLIEVVMSWRGIERVISGEKLEFQAGRLCNQPVLWSGQDGEWWMGRAGHKEACLRNQGLSQALWILTLIL